MLSSGTDGYTWDARNRLVSTLSGASFQYDPFGRRVGKTISGTTTNNLYDGVNVVQELMGGAPSASLLTGGTDQVFARTDAAGARSFLTDALGSTLALTDSTGTFQAQYTYEPFGNTAVTGTSTNSYQYTGRENDGTGLYYYRARYYSAALQRFIGEDPLRLKDGTNKYAYVSNSPTNFTDPLGRDKQPGWWKTFGKEFFKLSGGPGNVPTCGEQALIHIVEDFVPFTPSIPSVIQATAPAAQALAFNSAVGQTVAGVDAYIAARGLTVPLRSGIVRAMIADGAEGAVAAGARANLAVQTVAVDVVAVESMLATMQQARSGTCAAAFPVF